MEVLKEFVLNVRVINDKFQSLEERYADEGEHILRLTKQLTQLASKYNYNSVKIWKILTNFERGLKNTLTNTSQYPCCRRPSIFMNSVSIPENICNYALSISTLLQSLET